MEEYTAERLDREVDDLCVQLDELFAGKDPAVAMVSLIEVMAGIGAEGYFASNKYEFMGRVLDQLSERYDFATDFQEKE